MAQRSEEQIWKAIHRARRRAGLSQAELGEFVGADRYAIADLERGKLTTQLRRLLDVLDAVGLELQVRPRTERLATAADPAEEGEGAAEETRR